MIYTIYIHYITYGLSYVHIAVQLSFWRRNQRLQKKQEVKLIALSGQSKKDCVSAVARFPLIGGCGGNRTCCPANPPGRFEVKSVYCASASVVCFVS